MFTLAGQIVGYIPDYEYGNFSKIDLTAVTHLNYFSVVANSSGALGTTSASGYNFSQLTSVVNAAHAASPRVSVSITIDPSSAFQEIADNNPTPTATATFITNILSFCSTYHLDGIDLDYEPGSLTTAQINSWGNFLAALHAQTAADGLTLSEAVQASQDIVPTADYSDLDWFYMMDYDLEYNSSAPLSDWESYLTNWTNYGVPKSKLVVGVPFYGLTGTSWSNSTAATYGSLLSAYYSSNNDTYPGPKIDSITTGGKTYGFDSISDVQNMSAYILQNGYAGMMIWELGQDHFTSTGYDQYSLLPAIKAAFTLPITVSAGASYTITSTALTLTSGTITATGDVSAIDPNLSVTIGSGASLILDATEHLPSLTINGGTVSASGGGVIVLGALSISGGSFNLENDDLIIHHGNLAAVTALIAVGYNGGSWNGSTGITSSTAAAAGNTALAVELNNNGSGGVLLGTFDGQTVTTSDLLVKYTYFGDADLNGVVNGSDYTLIDNGLNNALTGWRNGDFNYDGVVNGDDYTLIDNAFNTQGAAILAQPAELILVSAVPVPSAFKSKTAITFPPTPVQSAVTASDDGSLVAPQSDSIDNILTDAIGD